MHDSLISVQSLVNGNNAQQIIDPSTGNPIFGVSEGASMAFRITNNSNLPICVVVGVDGKSLVHEGNFSIHDQGYIIRPRDMQIVDCYRFNTNTGGAIRATLGQRSTLVEQTGSNPVMQGVIEIAVFEEQIQRMQYISKSGGNMSFGEPTRSAGAYVGETVSRPVTEVDFKRSSSTPKETWTAYYEDIELLAPFLQLFRTRLTSFGQTGLNRYQQR